MQLTQMMAFAKRSLSLPLGASVLLLAQELRAEVIQVQLLGPNSLFTSYESADISFELNNILASATGYSGSSATTTVTGGRSLTEAYYHPFHRQATRPALLGNYDYLVLLPETDFTSTFPEMVFDGVLQMSRRALNAGSAPLLLMPGVSNAAVSNYGANSYRIANGCGIDVVPGGYSTQSGGLLAPATPLDIKRQAYLLAATIFTKITGLNAATDSTYISTQSGTPIDVANLANIAASTVSTHLNTTHYSTSRENTGRIRYRNIAPPNGTVRYAWTGSSTETGIKDALNPIITASGFTPSDTRASASQGWSQVILDGVAPTFNSLPNQFLFAYGRTSLITVAGQSLINTNQANILPFNFDRHFDNPGSGTPSIDAMLDDIYNRPFTQEGENSTYGWGAIPFHLGIARLNDVDPTIVFSNDNVHVTSPLYNMMAAMMLTSSLGRDPIPTAAILASAQDLKGFNVGIKTIKDLAFLAETQAFVPDTKLSIVGSPSINVTKGVTIDQTFTAINGTAPFTWLDESTAGLPAGLSLSPSGRLSGFTNISPGSRQLVLRVRDSTGAIRKLSQTLIVTALPTGTSALLSNQTLSTGILTPAFDSNIFNYATTVHPATTSIAVTPFATDSAATVRVNGTIVSSGTPSNPITLNFGPNVITTEVTSQNLGQTRTYTFTVTRASFSTNADLAGIAPSSGTLSPVFQSNTLSYTATVADLNTIAVTPTTADLYAIVRVNGNLVNSGTLSSPIALVTGTNPITLQVQSSDLSTTKTYTLTITREDTSLRWWDGGNADIVALGDGSSQGSASGVWNTTTQNWDQGPSRAHLGWENTGTKIAIFGGTPGTVTAQNVTVAGLTFTSAYTVTGGTITFAQSGTIQNSADVTIASTVAGNGPMTKSGAGTLTLSATSNPYGGGTQITAGRLTLINATTGSSNFTLTANSALEIRATTGNRQLSQGNLSGNGTFIKSGSSQLLLGAQNNPQTISLTTGGLIDVQAGSLRNEFGNSAWTNNKADLNVASGAFFDLWDGTATVDTITGTGLINKAWSGTTALTIGADNGSGTFGGRISNTNSHGGGYGGVGGGTLNLIKNGSGTQTLTGINTYTGTTTVSAGTLALVGGSQASAISVSSGASLGFTLGSPTTSTSSFNLTAGTIRIVGSPTLASHPLITSSSSITGTPTLHTPLPGYALNVNGTSLSLVRVLSYAIWAGTQASTGTAADDFDGDGISNGAEYVLGGGRLTQDQARLPKISTSANSMVITFQRHQQSLDGLSQLFVEVGTSLTTWSDSYLIPSSATSNNPGVTVVKNSPPGFDTITLSLPRASDLKKFARLRVIAN